MKKINKLSCKEKLNKLRQVIDDIFWMAMRYANGRQTSAPDDVRKAYYVIKQVFPDFKLKYDRVIIRDANELREYYKEKNMHYLESDFLDDLILNNEKNK